MYEECPVIRNDILCNGYKRLTIAAGRVARQAEPGRFVMLKCWEGNDPFFMRPFSINSVDSKAELMDILYKVRGRGTQLMAQVEQHSTIQVMGPLGHGFPLDPSHRTIALLGRGIGAAPLRFLAERARSMDMEVHVLLSASKPEYLFDSAALSAIGAEVYATCDPDENIAETLESLMRRTPVDAAYSCGSNRVMRGLSDIHKKYRIPCYVSLEERMGCGVGACKSCNCKTTDSEDEVCICKEGPVFPVERICK